MRRVIFIISLLVLLTVVFSGCTGVATPAPEHAERHKNRQRVLYMHTQTAGTVIL